jgi:hypothetical protein
LAQISCQYSVYVFFLPINEVVLKFWNEANSYVTSLLPRHNSMELDNSSNVSKEGTNGSLSPSKVGSTLMTTNFTCKMRRHRAYFTPEEVATLSQKQGTGTSQDTQEKMRQLACTFMEAVGQRMGL